MIRRATVAAALVLSAHGGVQPPQTVALGHNMYAVMGRTAGTAGDTAAAVPQSNTFMLVTQALAGTDPITALGLTDVALASVPDDGAVLEARIAALRALDSRSTNGNERGWLRAAIPDAGARLKR